MKFGICVINHGRPRVLDLFIQSMVRLRKEVCAFPVVCVSGEEDKSTCESNDIHHITKNNAVVSRKWNFGVKYLMDLGCQYVMIIGSDDIMSNDLLRKLVAEMDKDVSLIGVSAVYFYGTHGVYHNRLLRFQSRTLLGPCKTIRRDILEKINGIVCPKDKNHGMDAMISKAIAPYVSTVAIVEGMVVDVKTDRNNLNQMSLWASKIKTPTPSQEFFDILSPQELKILRAL